MSNKSATSSQVISLPKGGGALSGMGETFSPDLFTGTGNFTIPIALPPGRNGFQPQLNLVYSTGNGNGPFGLGWSLSIPGVSRKTSKGVPRYNEGATQAALDHDNERRDVFILSGAEDLVPVSGAYPGRVTYRPRTEGLFAKIEHIRDATNSYWEVGSKDGLVSVYGTQASFGTDPATIADPSNRTHVFAWKLTHTQDPFGNRIEYAYERDSGVEGPHHWDQLNLAQIRYVDYGDDRAHPQFLVTVAFVYELRPDDPHSEYRPSFEIRTRKRCTRIIVRTDAETDQQIRTYDLIYLDQRPELTASLPINGVSLLSQVKVTGHDGNRTETLPPLEFRYTRFEPEQRDFFPLQGSDLPAQSLANPDLELVDLFGNGLPDLMEMNGTVRYWRNLGEGRFDLPRFMRDAPAGLALADAGVQFIDANGDGRTDLLVTNGAMSGYFPLSFGGLWDRKSFQRYRQAPSFNLEDPEVKLVDLDGDGVTDAIRSGSRLECFFNDPEAGWNKTRWVERQALNLFPNVNFSDPRVKWADFTGDGLQNIALVYDGNIEYWPNLGYGNWGKRIHMEHSPRFPYGYDPRRILIGDVDGDGLADIVYVDNTKVTLWINQSGNRWSDPITILGTPPVSDIDGVRLVDALGSGISGVLWSRDANGLSRDHVFFLDFTGGLKPYLLHEMDNHIGALTKVAYAPSTRFYLEDQRLPATRWKTTLPFPVQVVACVEVIDHFSKGKLTTEYHYHHGYWDGAEREFRGFGMVEQRDTESFETYDRSRLHGAEALFARVAPHYFSPPTLSKTWFHQGPVGEEFGDWQELDWSDQYWPGDPPILKHVDTVNQFLKGLAERRVKRDALRTLRGSILRTELYALDGSERAERPYTVSESSYGLVEIAPPGDSDTDRLHIFFPHATSQRTTQWERGDDPMTQVSFTRYTDDTNTFDSFGRPLAQTQIACPRGWRTVEDKPAEPYLATHTRTVYAEPIDPLVYIHTRVATATSYEIVSTTGKQVLDLAALKDASPDFKLIGQSLSFYDGDAFVGLPLKQVGPFGVVTRTESLVLTDEILQQAYGVQIPTYLEPTGAPVWSADYPLEFRTLLPRRAGYTFHSGSADPADPRGYFVNSDRRRYDFQTNPSRTGRGLVLETLDPLHRAAVDPSANRTLIAYDKFQFLPELVTDAAGLTVRATNDYRVLQPREVTDPNGNQSRFIFSPLGLLESSFVRGKNPTEGDQDRPSARMEFGFLAFENSPPGNPQPIFVRTIRHIHHDTELDVPLAKRDETITTVEYSDGFGRLLQTRTQGEEVRFGDEHFGGGEAVLPAKQSDGAGGGVVGRRNTNELKSNVVVSGWQIYDNKGQVVEKYEPFFAEGWDYDQPDDRKTGQKVAMFYDPRGQVIRTLNPDGSEQRVIYGIPEDLSQPDRFKPTPWEAYTYDANDLATVSRSPAGTPLTNAAPTTHHFTPASIEIDGLGRTVKAVERNGSDPANWYTTRSTYDIRGNVLTLTDALNRPAFQHVYDLANRNLKIVSIDAGVRRMVLDVMGNPVEQRDGKGALTLHSYDLLNRPTHLRARDGAGQVMTLRERSIYGDSAESGMTQAQAQVNNLLGKPYRHYDEAGLVTLAACDFKGNVLKKVQQVIRDEQILGVFNNAPANNWQVEAFRVNWQPAAGVTLDAHANTLLEAKAYITSMEYDALNRVKVMRYPQDVNNTRKELRPEYNRAGALERVLLDGKPYVDRIAYNAKGQRVLIAYGNGVMTRQTYDRRTFRLVRMRSERYTQPDALTYRSTGAALQEFAYEYDLVGNITKIHDRTPESGIPNSLLGTNALDRSFSYDPIYRLLAATGRECDLPPENPPWADEPRCTDLTKTRAYGESYQYDPMGNIRLLQHQVNGFNRNRNFALVNGNNRLATVTIGQTIYQYTYDDNGNLIQENGARHFEWDYGDRMRVFRTQTGNAEPSVHAHYLYDASGQRVKKLVRKQGGQIEVTVYIDGVFEYQRIVQGGVTRENNTLHVMDNQSRIALVRVGNPFPNDTTPAVKYHLGDHLGSSNVVIDEVGGWVNREEYTPYGETSFGSFARKQYRFTGKERDEESGLNYHGARYYAPWLGRWMTPDPAGYVDGLNLYVYVCGQPLNFVDPHGLVESDPFPPDPSREAAQGLRVMANGPSQVAKKVLDTWKDLRQKATDALFPRQAYDETKKNPELKQITPYYGFPVIDQIVKDTPGVSGNLWLIFAGNLKTGPTTPRAVQPFSPVARASSIYNKIVTALESAEGHGPNPNVAAFKQSGMVAVSRVTIAGKVKVYVGVKVPKGNMGAVESIESFPTKEVGEWVKKNALLEGEELAGVTASRTHAEGPIEAGIVRDAKAAGVDPATVEGTIGAKIDVCNGCTANLSKSLPNVKIENPAPPNK